MQKTMHRITGIVALCALGLTGCTAVPQERPDDNSAVSQPQNSGNTAQTSATNGHNTPAVSVVDTSIGGSKTTDPLWQGLATATHKKQPLYLDVVLHPDTPPKDSGTLTLMPSSSTTTKDKSVTVSVDASAVKKVGSEFYRIRGVFNPTSKDNGSFALKTLSTDEIPSLTLTGTTTKDVCTSVEKRAEMQDAAQKLADNPTMRDELRKEWGAAPEVWWGIQSTAALLRETDGQSFGDFLTTACLEYMQ